MDVSLLRAQEVSVHFGGVRACDKISFHVATQELVGLVGPNGSGKTTLLRALCGAVPVCHGSIQWGGRNIARWPTHRRARAGIVRTFQNPALFQASTLRRSLEIAGECRGRRRSGGESSTEVPEDPDDI